MSFPLFSFYAFELESRQSIKAPAKNDADSFYAFELESRQSPSELGESV